MAQVAAAAAAASSLLQGVSSFSSGMYQATIAKRNAEISKINAGKASDAAQLNAQESDREAADLMGQQLATQGSSGLGGSSQYYLRRATEDTYRRERENITLEGVNQSRGFLQESANYRAAASQARTQAWFGLASGALNAGSSYVGGSNPLKNKIGARLANGG